MIKINLLPYRDIKRKMEVRRLVLVLLAALGGVVGVIFMMETWVIVRANDLKVQIDTAQQEENRLAKIRTEVDRFKTVEADLTRRLEVLTNLRNSRQGPARFLEDLASSTPQRLWVEKFSESTVAPPAPPPQAPGGAGQQAQQQAAPPPPPPQRVFNVSGKTLDYKSIAEFMVNLNNTESFDEVELEEVQEEQQKEGKYLKFNLRGLIVKGVVL